MKTRVKIIRKKSFKVLECGLCMVHRRMAREFRIRHAIGKKTSERDREARVAYLGVESVGVERREEAKWSVPIGDTEASRRESGTEAADGPL